MPVQSPTPSRRRLLRGIALAVGTVGASSVLAACGGAAATATTTSPRSSAASAGTGSSSTATAAASTAASSSTGAGTPATSTATASSQQATASTTAVAGKGASLVFLSRGTETEQQVEKQLIQDFTQQHAGADVSFEWGPGDLTQYFTKLTAMTAGGTPPDLFYTHVYYSVDVVAQQIPLRLDPFVAKDHSFQLDNFFPASLDDFRVKGQLTGLPQLTTSSVLFFDRTLFQKNGVPEPAADWTWDTFLTSAGRLTRSDTTPKQWGTNLFSGITWVMVLTWQNGGDVMNQDRTASTIDSAPAVQAIQWVHDLMYKAHVQPTPADKVSGSAFNNGILATEPNISEVVSEVRAAKVSFDWDVMHLPVPTGKPRVTRSASAGFSITSGSKHPDDAWLFLSQGLASEAAYAQWAKVGLWIPPFKPVANAPAYRDPSMPPKNFQVVVDALGYSRSEPVTRYWLDARKAMDSGLAKVWAGTMSVGDAVAQIKQQVDAILART
jgi:multiple sugar transport system substrate-binding protein